ncbi:type II toxin-antitoxin system Phd/YefM family antitoxin [Halomicronema sp. CCY15110]|uniref:type II toxin-antitoxin system Phd/YefM family antitoxin n=1 Tax=Halomicronema sp. CCY15110 TaxID=2767773 RepID=UPI00194FFD7C|nr:type II toxin-antitoxin system Phd/YefM family antitoxin [Halomicronema sp. CCY15110]
MHHVTAAYAKAHLDELCDRVSQAQESVTIVRDDQSYVLLSQAEWESLIETAAVAKIPGILDDVKTARQDYDRGDAIAIDELLP